jgi:hypothetical protein
VLTYGTSVLRINIADPADAYAMEWLSLNGQASGINRAPIFHQGDILWTNSRYEMVSIDLLVP